MSVQSALFVIVIVCLSWVRSQASAEQCTSTSSTNEFSVTSVVNQTGHWITQVVSTRDQQCVAPWELQMKQNTLNCKNGGAILRTVTTIIIPPSGATTILLVPDDTTPVPDATTSVPDDTTPFPDDTTPFPDTTTPDYGSVDPDLNVTYLAGPGYTYYSDAGYYKLHFYGKTWDQANNTCTSEGGHLAVLNSMAEMKRLAKILKKHPKQFIHMGFHDKYSEGNFVTIFDEPLSAGFTTANWNVNQPNSYGGNEDCGAINRTGYMYDVKCSLVTSFFCEKQPIEIQITNNLV